MLKPHKFFKRWPPQNFVPSVGPEQNFFIIIFPDLLDIFFSFALNMQFTMLDWVVICQKLPGLKNQKFLNTVAAPLQATDTIENCIFGHQISA